MSTQKKDTQDHLRYGSAKSQHAHAVGVNRAGTTVIPDHKPSQKLHNQSAGAQRQGDTKYAAYPNAHDPSGDKFESTGHSGAGSRKC